MRCCAVAGRAPPRRNRSGPFTSSAVEGRTVGERAVRDGPRSLSGSRSHAGRSGGARRGAVLSGTTGAVLDPIFSLRRGSGSRRARRSVSRSPRPSPTRREEALALADAYHDFHGITRAFELAWAHSQVELHHYHLTTEDVHLFQRLAAHLIYTGPFLRAAPTCWPANRQGQPGLWRHGISGDKPIVLLDVAGVENWRWCARCCSRTPTGALKGLEVDLVHPQRACGGLLRGAVSSNCKRWCAQRVIRTG